MSIQVEIDVRAHTKPISVAVRADLAWAGSLCCPSLAGQVPKDGVCIDDTVWILLPGGKRLVCRRDELLA